MGMKFNKDALKMLEAPWLKKQIENHLIFGFCSRNLPFSVFFVALCVFYLLYEILTSKISPILQLANNFQFVFFTLIGLYLLKMPRYHQAAIGWWVINVSLFFMCFVAIIAGGLVGFFKGSPDAIHIILFGFVWLPSLEFVPRLTEKQKYITIGRLAVTIPLLILWQQTGTWH